MSQLRIALADDQALIRGALAALLPELGIEVAIEAADGHALLEALHRERVDVVVSDIRMPRMSGLDVATELRNRADPTPVLLLTTFDDPALLAKARTAGARGFLLKDAEPQALADAIRRVAAGETLLAPLSLDGLQGAAPALDTAPATRITPREQDILRLVAGGYSNKEIGRVLHISDGTVRNHISDILAKLEARDRTHAVIKALSAKLL